MNKKKRETEGKGEGSVAATVHSKLEVRDNGLGGDFKSDRKT